MNLSMKVSGFPQTLTMLRSVGPRVVETARKQMHRSAARVVKLAKQMTPVDERALENSIRIERSYGDSGRLQIDIVAGGQETFRGDRSVNLDQYAYIIHELYGTMTPGPETIAKQAANPGVIVGERFLSRAAETEEKKLTPNLVSAVTAIIRSVNS